MTWRNGSGSRTGEKESVVAASVYQPLKLRPKWWVPGTAGSCSKRRQSTGWNSKKASCCTLLKRVANLKNVNSEIIRSRIRIPTWKGIPRRVHATVTNAAWITHLLRTVIANSDVECTGRAKTPTISWHEECIFIKIYRRIITVDVDHIKQQR